MPLLHHCQGLSAGEVTLITLFKESTIGQRTACGGKDCQREEGFPTAKGKESTEELAIAAGRAFWAGEAVDSATPHPGAGTCKRGNVTEPQGGRHGQIT